MQRPQVALLVRVQDAAAQVNEDGREILEGVNPASAVAAFQPVILVQVGDAGFVDQAVHRFAGPDGADKHVHVFRQHLV